MKTNRSKLIQHLERLYCGGQCPEVVFTGAFAAAALTVDHLLFVDVPGVAGAEPLPHEIGLSDVAQFIKALKLLAGEGNLGVDVEVRVQDHRLVIDEGDRGELQLVTAAPKTIATRLEPATVQKLVDVVPAAAPAIPLTRHVLEGVRGAFALFGAEEVEIRVGPTGSAVCVGSETTHRAEFVLDAQPWTEEYTLLFGRQLVDVFSVITDYSSAGLRVSGAKKPVLIDDGGYRYLVSPRARGADGAAKKKK